MDNIAIIDETFDINVTSSYHLSLQVCTHSISLAILDTIRMKFLAFKHIRFTEEIPDEEMPAKIESLFNTEPYLHRNYKHFYFAYITPSATLVPTPLFKEEDAQEFLKFSVPVKLSDKILHRPVSGLDAQLLYAVPEELINLTKHHISNTRFFHHAIPFIENGLIEAKGKSNTNRVLTQIHHHIIDIVVVQDGKFMLYNSFPYRTHEDLVFFVLYIFDQFALNTTETELIISGIIDKNEDFDALIRKYIRRISYQEFNRSFTYSYTFNDLPQHSFTNLINLFRCE